MKYVENPWIIENSLEERLYQKHIAETAVNGNTLVVLPTGLGKTPIAVLVTAYRLQEDMDKKILVMAPTKPLVNQHKKSFEKFMKIGPSELKIITGETKPTKRIEQYQKADIVFSTPQTIKNDLKSGRMSLDNFSLLIVDECHRAVKDYAYTYVAKVYRNQAKKPLIVGLTASPGGYKMKIQEVKKKLGIEHVEMRTRDDEDVKPYIQDIELERVEVTLSPELKETKKYLENIYNQLLDKLKKWKIINNNNVTKRQLLEKQKKLAKANGGYRFTAMSVIAELLKLDHAIGLLETQSLYSLKKYMNKMKQDAKAGETKAVERLVKKEDFKKASKLTKLLVKKNVEHPKIEKLKEIIKRKIKEKPENLRIIVFAQFRDTLEKIVKELNKIKKAKPIKFIGQAKKAGSGLKQEEQIKIVNEFKLGFHNILCSSSIGEEGLDIAETDMVIFYEPVPSAVRKIQRSGRTGRAKKGEVVILMTKDTRDEAYYWAGYHKERKMKKMIKDMRDETQKDLSEF